MTIHDVLPRLPDPEALRRRCRAFAALDAAFDARYPHHTFQEEWGPGVALASRDNGSGDLYEIVFDPAGVFLYAFDHESAATPWRVEEAGMHLREHWPGLLDGLPEPLRRYTEEPAFLFEDFFDATVCAWWTPDVGRWRCGPVEFGPDEDDGADWLFELVAAADPVAAYAAWASDYFEKTVDAATVTDLARRAGHPRV